MASNKKTKINLRRRLCWHDFRELLLQIKKDYDIYGEIVLKKRLGKSKDTYINAFASKDFLSEIRKIWNEEQHLIATNFSELISVYEMDLKHDIDWNNLLPETSEYRYKYEHKGNDMIFALSKELYDNIVQKTKRASFERIYLEKNGLIYQLSLEEKESNSTYRKISMERIDIIKVD